MNSALMDQFVEKLSELATSADLRALVLTGAGDKAFIGGADIREMSALSDAEEGRRFITRLHQCCDAMRTIPVPTIVKTRLCGKNGLFPNPARLPRMRQRTRADQPDDM